MSAKVKHPRKLSETRLVKAVVGILVWDHLNDPDFDAAKAEVECVREEIREDKLTLYCTRHAHDADYKASRGCL